MEFIDKPAEQTTAATDAILALLALGCVLYLRRIGQRDLWKTNVWSWTFALLILAGLLGAIAHGFKMSPQTNDLFWQPLNLTLGLVVALFVIGVAYDTWGRVAARRALPVMIVIGLAFFGLTRLIPGTFFVFIVYEAIAMLFALVAYGRLALKGRLKGAGLMTTGVLIMMVAAGIQAGESASLTLIWQFDHNGLFHLIQMVGVLMLLAGLRAGLLRRSYPTAPKTS